MSKDIQALYTMLVNVVPNKDLRELTTMLRDYIINGSMQDYETNDNDMLGFMYNIIDYMNFKDIDKEKVEYLINWLRKECDL